MSEEIKSAWQAILAAGVLGGILGALLTTILAHRLTKKRESFAGISNRKREFLAFMQQWKHEIDRWHFGSTGGRERRQMAFYEGGSEFCARAEIIRGDFKGANKAKFGELVATITKHGKLEYGYKHEDLIKTIDELIAIAEKN